MALLFPPFMPSGPSFIPGVPGVPVFSHARPIGVPVLGPRVVPGIIPPFGPGVVRPFVPIAPSFHPGFQVNRFNPNDNFDINIKKKDNSSELTDGNIAYLKNKINELNAIYNVILKHLCIKRKNMNSYDVFDNIKKELTSLNAFGKYCLGSRTLPPGQAVQLNYDPTGRPGSYIAPIQVALVVPVAGRTSRNITENIASTILIPLGNVIPTVKQYRQILDTPGVNKLDLDAYLATLGLSLPPGTNNQCNDMFSDDKLRELINSIFNDAILSKVCHYKMINGQIFGENLKANVQFTGGGKQFNLINLNTIIKDSGSNHNHKSCDYCNEWSEGRKLFKNQFINMLNSDLNSNINLMIQSLDVLPTVMLDQEQYNKFYTLYNKFVSQKK